MFHLKKKNNKVNFSDSKKDEHRFKRKRNNEMMELDPIAGKKRKKGPTEFHH